MVLLRLLITAAASVAIEMVGRMIGLLRPMVETLMTWWWENSGSATAWFLELARHAIQSGWVILQNGCSLLGGFSTASAAFLRSVTFHGVINVVIQSAPRSATVAAAVLLTAGGYWLWKWYWTPATDQQVTSIALRVLRERADEVIT